MLYRFFRPLIFRLDAEKAHHIGMMSLDWMELTGLSWLLTRNLKSKPVRVMGLTFPNALGLAAGLDKNGDHIESLAALGFGFVEIGTVTPRPQPGNPKPRLFRLPEAQGIINRMGFNNLGVDHLVAQVKASSANTLIGINIGKNFDTPVEKAVDDYLISMDKVYEHADYITINISSPNTPGLRTLQFGESLDNLLASLKTRQAELAKQHQKYVPMAVKVAPDLSHEEVDELARAFNKHQIDAVIATNTTMDRSKVSGLDNADEVGGLSGGPVFEKSTEIVRLFRSKLSQELPIIAAGGIMSADDAIEKLDAGAALVQIYSGLIYQGPSLVRHIIQAIYKRN
ncbi:hypothetical protein LCGC14_1289420 [marine sediment metagenome]|uniref:dihydroorotate dehydrogenase (quinone) n=2 Tax=root TaxID=1 RepID=A0A0F9KUK0_9ZZZZ